jgi:Lon protease-like protein
VVQRLRGHFDSAPEHDAPDPFNVLRHASLMSRVLWPPADGIPETLPTFILPSHTLLVGERAQFMLFEPRYTRLARIALGASHDGDPSRADHRFVHAPLTKPDALARGSEEVIGTLVSILSHEVLDGGRFLVECVAGPRIALTAWHSEEVAGGLPLAHVEVSLDLKDVPSESPEADAAMARQCLALLQSVDTPDVLAQAAVAPPLFNTERFSFFLCQLLLPSDDTERRLQWLYSRSTTDRLGFCLTALERWAARKAGKEP